MILTDQAVLLRILDVIPENIREQEVGFSLFPLFYWKNEQFLGDILYQNVN